MVQRKVTDKLGIQAERLSMNHKSASAQQENVKKGGMDLKKKMMKKSGSIKHPEADGSRKQHVKQPGKPPTETITTPNYMKGTSSSDARKEKLQVSAKTPQTSPDNSSLRRKSSSPEKLGLASDKKAKSLARMTSLKLTSTRSFKPVRVTAKKCSSVALCENIDVQRATCSSTLKDCKFPTYLTLSPGGTELEGTSAMKVCPYTYCSLNGHRHAALPPLKTFLSAKRRMIKTQRSVKLGCLSPRRTRPANQLDVSSPIVTPSTQEEVNDFFVEIYAPKEDDTAIVPMVEGAAETGAENHKTQEDQSDIMEPSTEAAQSFEMDSEASDTEWETGHGSAVYLDDDDDEYSSEAEKQSDPEGGKLEGCLVEDDNLIQSGKFLDNEVSQETIDEEGFGSDSWSSSEDCECIEYLETLMDVNGSATVNCPEEEEELEATSEYMHEASLEGGQTSETGLPTGDIGDKGLLSTITADDVPDQTSAGDEFQIHNTENQDNQDGNFHNMRPTHPTKESRSAEPETEDSSLTIVIGKGKKLIQDPDELGQFNPRDPNFLPVQPDPEAENVDLKHQELDERKNAEEWMVDFALRQVVTKLGSARKRKVALLVEAFEKVIPMTKCEFHQTHSSVFESPRPMQACI